MTRKPPSMLTRLIDATADAAAKELTRTHPGNTAAMRDTLRSVMHAQWSTAFGGERIRLWTARTPPPERQARQDRIQAGLRAGEAPSVIAAREGVSAHWVRRLRRGTDRA